MGLTDLPDVEFCSTDPETIEKSVITFYEGLTKASLYPGDPVRLFLESLAAVIIQQRQIINHAGKQNLLKYARKVHLDHLGSFTRTERLDDAPAFTRVRFSIDQELDFEVLVPKETRVSPDGKLMFKTSHPARIPPGALHVDVRVECLAPGTQGNGFLPGQITHLVDPLDYIGSVSNIETTSGGADSEKDDPYRERIQTAPEGFSVAGPTGAYGHWAKSAHQDIVDVSVFRSSPLDDLTNAQLNGVLDLAGIDPNGLTREEKQIRVATWLSPSTVNICPLLSRGRIPDSAMVDRVADRVNDRKVRPLTDRVVVAPPELVNYDIDLTYYVSPDNRLALSDIQAAIARALETYIAGQREKLGRAVNPDQLVHLLIKAGALRVAMKSPVHTPVGKNAVAREGAINMVFGGFDGE